MLEKVRQIIDKFKEVLHLLVDYSIKLSKSNNNFWLTEWDYHCPVAPEVFWRSVKEHIWDVVQYTQKLSCEQEFNTDNIKLILSAIEMHVL